MNTTEQQAETAMTTAEKFEMVAKTFQGLEDVLAEELVALGAEDVEPGRRMVAFKGDKALLYKANMCCRTALRILKPFYKFRARTADQLYDRVKEYDWSTLLDVDSTFSIESTVNSDEFTHSRFVTYRVKDAIVDFFRDRSTDGRRPGVRLQDADAIINVHIAGMEVTLSLDSSGESLHRRGYRAAQTEAPINEVLAAGIIMKSGWKGDTPFVDPMCGSGTFVVEAAMIAANINPGVYRRGFAFERWADFDRDLFDSIYNDDSQEREVTVPIVGADISPKAIAIATENVKSAGVAKYVRLQVKPLSQWTEAPKPGGVVVTNPPYGERISVADMDGLYGMLGEKLKHVFTGYHAWIIGYREEYFAKIGLSPSVKLAIYNGSLECELREYVIFDGEYREFRKKGGSIKNDRVESRPRRKDHDRGGFERRGRQLPGGDKEAREQYRQHEHRDVAPAASETESENPLARRRNEGALKSILNRKPQLAPDGQHTTTTVMRSRRGWKKSGDKE